ncbi:MAG TPA: DUF4870 domain-containing protein [Bacteroidales bacterium]|jgi:uncharacterized Tic20 family protein|nr:DUF4870 domain-containing protein [Bacteroidales bacterium]
MEENRLLTETERNWAMLCHLSAFAGFFFPFGGVIGPLICYLSKKDESAWINVNGRASLNFNLSMLLYIILALPLMIIIIGIPIIMALGILKIVCITIGSVKAARGEMFKYPLAIPFIQ